MSEHPSTQRAKLVAFTVFQSSLPRVSYPTRELWIPQPPHLTVTHGCSRRRWKQHVYGASITQGHQEHKKEALISTCPSDSPDLSWRASCSQPSSSGCSPRNPNPSSQSEVSFSFLFLFFFRRESVEISARLAAGGCQGHSGYTFCHYIQSRWNPQRATFQAYLTHSCESETESGRERREYAVVYLRYGQRMWQTQSFYSYLRAKQSPAQPCKRILNCFHCSIIPPSNILGFLSIFSPSPSISGYSGHCLK